MADDLELSYALADALRNAGVNSAAAGAQPSSAATRTGATVAAGDVVFDPITGLHGVVHHVSTQTALRLPAKQA